MRHTIRRNHAAGIPQNHVVLDTETTPVPIPDSPGRHVHRLRLAVARRFRFEGGRFGRLRECVAGDRNTILDWLLAQTNPRNPVWVWCHNAGFDLTAIGLWMLFESGEIMLETPDEAPGGGSDQRGRKKRRVGVLVTDDPPTIVKCFTRTGATMVFVDTLNWFMCPLSELGEAHGLPKLDMPGECGEDSDWEAYCRRDVEILQASVQSLLSFVSQADLGNLRYTAASQAMALFRHRCLTCDIHTDDRSELKVLERAAYFGGRKEVYYAGAVVRPELAGVAQLAGVKPGVPVLAKGPAIHLDLTAAYPSVMRDNVYPVSYIRSVDNPTPEDLLGWMSVYCCCASVRISTGCDSYPVKRSGRTIQAIGDFDTCLCGPELIRALRQKDVKMVHLAQLYVADRPFTRFVDACWELRDKFSREGKPLYARLAKLLANSLHGKFGQRSHRWELVPGHVAPCLWGAYAAFDESMGQWECFRSIGGAVQRRGKSEEPAGSFPAIAAYCTSYCRELMYKIRWEAGLREVLYEDSDSIHVTEQGYLALQRRGWIDTAKPGRLKEVCRGDVTEYRGPLDYTMGNRRVVGGLARRAVEDEHGVWHQTNFDRLDSTLTGVPPEGPMVSDVTVSRPVHQILARVGPDGWTSPILLKEAKHATPVFAGIAHDAATCDRAVCVVCNRGC